MIKEKQIWTYKSRVQDPDSYLKILRIDKNDTIHVSVKNVWLIDDYYNIDHMPFSYDVLEKSLLELIKEEEEISGEIELVEEWQNVNGGIFNISIIEAINLTEHGISSLNDQNNEK